MFLITYIHLLWNTGGFYHLYFLKQIVISNFAYLTLNL